MYSGKEGKKASNLPAVECLHTAGGLFAKTLRRRDVVRSCHRGVRTKSRAGLVLWASRVGVTEHAPVRSEYLHFRRYHFSHLQQGRTSSPIGNSRMLMPVIRQRSVQDCLRASLAHAQLARLPPPFLWRKRV
jgi:hypothetical protein